MFLSGEPSNTPDQYAVLCYVFEECADPQQFYHRADDLLSFLSVFYLVEGLLRGQVEPQLQLVDPCVEEHV
jgi:hypothetical protein